MLYYVVAIITSSCRGCISKPPIIDFQYNYFILSHTQPSILYIIEKPIHFGGKKISVLCLYENAMHRVGLANFESVTKKIIGQGFKFHFNHFIFFLNCGKSLNLILPLLRSKNLLKEKHEYSLANSKNKTTEYKKIFLEKSIELPNGIFQTCFASKLCL